MEGDVGGLMEYLEAPFEQHAEFNSAERPARQVAVHLQSLCLVDTFPA